MSGGNDRGDSNKQPRNGGDDQRVIAHSIRSFIMRRTHSIMGIFLSLFLIEHLITNSQAALWVGEDGAGFIRMVNFIHSLPYLPVLEITLLLIPFLIHMVWGVVYLREAAPNCSGSDGSKPRMHFALNRNYSWQRYTAWLLLLGVVAHVVHMRLLSHPQHLKSEHFGAYAIAATFDPGIYTLSSRLGIKLYDLKELQAQRALLVKKEASLAKEIKLSKGDVDLKEALYSPEVGRIVVQEQTLMQERIDLDTMEALVAGETPVAGRHESIIIASPNFGVAALMMVREVFKNRFIAIAYSFYVVAAAFHAFNGLWSAMIVWGTTRSRRAQRLWYLITRVMIVKFSLLGLCAIWFSYHINLLK